MGKRWRRLSALGLAVVLGCMMPMRTMRAAEETAPISEKSIDAAQEAGQSESVCTDAVQEAEESEQDYIDVVQEAEQPEEDYNDAIQETEESEQEYTDVEQDTEQVYMSEELQEVSVNNIDSAQESGQTYAAAEEKSAPVIRLTFQGQDLTRSLGGAIANVYVGNPDQRVSILVESVSDTVSLSYYLDENAGDESRSEEELASLWQQVGQLTAEGVVIKKDAKNVLYVKAEANGLTAYARTDGIVVDTIAPVITGIENGGTYPAGTKFGVSDANLDTVMVNENLAAPDENGQYSVEPNGLSTSCIIRVKDKADHETVYNITVTGEVENPGGSEEPGENEKPDEGDTPGGNEKPDEGDTPGEDDEPGEGEVPGDDIIVITKSGTYSLYAGTAYRLGSGNWKVGGDSTVYRGGVTFYVSSDGDYQFNKR